MRAKRSIFYILGLISVKLGENAGYFDTKIAPKMKQEKMTSRLYHDKSREDSAREASHFSLSHI